MILSGRAKDSVKLVQLHVEKAVSVGDVDVTLPLTVANENHMPNFKARVLGFRGDARRSFCRSLDRQFPFASCDGLKARISQRV